MSSQHSLTGPRSWRFSHRFFSKTFIFLTFTFKSMLHFRIHFTHHHIHPFKVYSTVQLFLILAQNCVMIATIRLKNISSLKKKHTKKPYSPITNHCPFFPLPSHLMGILLWFLFAFSRRIMVLSIFSSLYRPFECLWRNVYSDPLPHLILLFFSF